MDIFFDAIKFIFPFFIYLFQFAITFGIAMVFSFLPYIVLKKFMHNAYFFALVLSIAVIFSSVYFTSSKPLIICDEIYKSQLTDEVKAKIYEESSGIYSKQLPIFPIYIKIRSINQLSIKYDTKYLYFGSSYTEISEITTTELILD